MSAVIRPTWDVDAGWHAMLRNVRRRLRPRRHALRFGPPLQPDAWLSQSYIVVVGAAAFWLSFL